ncbi:transposase [Sulfuricurvum sp.]|uniref:transposase n=1 Tax=Sulfuricurvum sp. TaxID=2025608 RepID=UPI003C42A5C6
MKHEEESTRADRVGQVQITFTNKQLTAWGGACSVVAKFLERIRFREWVLEHMPVEERSPNAKGVYEKVLALLLTSLTGGTRFSHVTWWSHGMGGLKACFGVVWLPQATSVLTRFFGKFRQRHNEALRTAAVGLAGTLIEAEKITQDTLILDSTVCERYGVQEGARKGYNPKKPGRPSHHPLKAGLGSGYVVNLWNRRGDTHTAHQCVTFYDQTCRELPRGLRIGWILADSGFGEEGFLEHLEGEKQRYVIALRLTAYVLSAIRGISGWKLLEKGLEVAEVTVALSTWKKARRLIVIRQHVPTRPKASGKQPMLFRELEEHREYRYSVLVTHETTLSPEEIWRTYRPRAHEENCIKELKEGYGWHEFNVHSFWGTEAAMLLIGMVCYNLVHHLNRQVLKTAEEGVARLKTLRLKVLAIPAIYGSGGRRPTLRLGVQDRGLRAKIHYWLHRIHRLDLRLFNCNAVALPVTAKV